MLAKITILAHLRRNALNLYSRNGALGQLVFPDEVVHNLEVLDKPRFVDVLDQFMQHQRLHKERVLIVLDGGIVFQKAITLTQNIKVDELVADFESKVPFESSVCQVVRYTTRTQVLLCGMNRAYYEQVVRAFEGTANKVMAAVPGPVYGLRETTKIEPEQVHRMLGNKKLMQHTNLLQNAKQ